MNSAQKIERKGFLALFLLLLGLALYLLSPFLKTLLLSLILAVLFFPLHRKILKVIPRFSNLAAFLSTLSVSLLLFIPLLILLSFIVSQVTSLLNVSPGENFNDNVQSILSQSYVSLQIWVTKLEDFFGIHFNLLGSLQQIVRHVGDYLAQYSPAVVLKTADFLLNLFILLFVLFYFFRDGRRFFELSLRLLPLKDQYERKLALEMQKTISGVFYGSFLASLTQAIVATFGYWMAGLEGYLVWGFITFFVSFIPIVGTATVIVPLVLSLLLQGQNGAALFLSLYSAVVTGLTDNVLKTFLIPSNMHTLALFLSILGGLAVFGPMGLLLGPLIMSLLTATLKMYAQDFTVENKNS